VTKKKKHHRHAARRGASGVSYGMSAYGIYGVGGYYGGYPGYGLGGTAQSAPLSSDQFGGAPAADAGGGDGGAGV